MYAKKLDLIQDKLSNLINRVKGLENENENLLTKIHVLEQELKLERSGKGHVIEKHEIDQHSEPVKTPSLFDEPSQKDLKKKIDGFIEEIDQCIEIIEKK